MGEDLVAERSSTGTVARRHVEYGRTSSSDGLYASRFGYTGLRYFSSLRISYARNRMLHHETGRFLQADPIGYGGGMNMYAYVGGDPVNRVDPTGMWWASRIELKRDESGGTSWGFSSGGSSHGGLLDSGGDVRVAVANNVYWERTDGSGGQWGGNVVYSGGSFRVAGGAGSASSGMSHQGQGGPIETQEQALTYDQVASLVDRANFTGIPDAVVIAQIWKESRFNPNARSPDGRAIGLMQLRPIAVREVNRIYGVDIEHRGMINPLHNVFVGTIYLEIEVQRHGGLAAGLNAYGTGPGYSGSIIRAANALNGSTDPMAVLRREIGR
jgi:RHS repeat-associated protein